MSGPVSGRVTALAGGRAARNPAAGRELHVPHVVSPTIGRRRKAVVVGGGPAGLEAARVLGERGHHVVLFEASDQPGGQIRLAVSNPRRGDLIQIVDWRLAECNTSASTCARERTPRPTTSSPNTPTVIVATGGTPNRSFPTHPAQDAQRFAHPRLPKKPVPSCGWFRAERPPCPAGSLGD